MFHIRLPNLGVLAWGEDLPENLALKTSGFHHRSSTIIGKQRLHSWMAHTRFHTPRLRGKSSDFKETGPDGLKVMEGL